MIPRVEAAIDKAALTHNFDVIRKLISKDTQIMPMVKANAYGHGLIEVAMHLKDADAFGVATLLEAFRLRTAGIEQDIFVMCGFRNSEELTLFSELDLTAVIHHEDQIDWLSQAHLSQPLSVWLKLETGMHRLGIAPAEFEASYQRLNQSSNVKQPFGLMTHLANADGDADFTNQQLALFQALTGSLENPKSIANSAGLIAFDTRNQHLVRPGIMLYGVSPFSERSGYDLGLKPAMTLTSGLVSYKKIKKGDVVGYGCNWQANSDTLMGIVTVGYGDGYPRHANNGTPILIQDKICPLIGRVSMDMLAIDLSAVTNPKIGDRVLLWGPELPIETVAAASNTIAYELLTQLTDRVIKRHL